ncbi:hypothetical protein NEOLEDRAFT_279948 [Neolentinus lepideus HHB14362 ss-1]|uniref:DUF6534 domain-containing protein n=1 Tax=Neolentinus lepideus HHB14362 ss-1 TaxID=1314782 RepID=A0A165SYG7_9AGAM|nr:hypothetical protein NEOLEDRAFT_279948 [Neolentinus lepideus HHB14362 ss-1]
MADNCTTAVIPPDINLLVGPQLFGFLFNWGLFGVLSVQVYLYYLYFPGDNRRLKALVYGLYIFETAQTALATSDAVKWLVTGWGRPEALQKIYTSWLNVPVMGGMISATVQLFFCWRIWILSNSIYLPIVIALVALVSGTAGVASGIMLRRLDDISEISTLTPPTSVWLTCSALADVLIAIAMTYLLTRAKVGLRRTDRLINRLVRLTIETGMVTALWAVVDVILFNAFKHNNLHMCPATTLAKLYSNTLLVMFNNRQFVERNTGPTSLASTTIHRDRWAASQSKEPSNVVATFMLDGPEEEEIALDNLQDSESSGGTKLEKRHPISPSFDTTSAF